MIIKFYIDGVDATPRSVVCDVNHEHCHWALPREDVDAVVVNDAVVLARCAERSDPRASAGAQERGGERSGSGEAAAGGGDGADAAAQRVVTQGRADLCKLAQAAAEVD